MKRRAFAVKRSQASTASWSPLTVRGVARRQQHQHKKAPTSPAATQVTSRNTRKDDALPSPVFLPASQITTSAEPMPRLWCADCLSQNGTQAPLPHYDLVTSTLHVISLQTHCCARCTLLSISQVILWSCLRLPTAPAICCNVSQNLLSPSPRIHLTPMSYTPSHSTSITVYDSPRFWQGGSKRWATALAHGAQVLQHRTLLPK